MSLILIGSLHCVSRAQAADVTGIFRAHVIEVVGCSTCTRTVGDNNASVTIPVGIGNTARLTLKTITVGLQVPTETPKGELTYERTRVDFGAYGQSVKVDVNISATFTIGEFNPNRDPARDPDAVVYAKGTLLLGGRFFSIPRGITHVVPHSEATVTTAVSGNVVEVIDGPGHGFPATTRRVAFTRFLVGAGYSNGSPSDSNVGEVQVSTYYDFPTGPDYYSIPSPGTAISFGTFPVGVARGENVDIDNNGSGDLNISDMTIINNQPGLQIYSVGRHGGVTEVDPHNRYIIPPGGGIQLHLIWEPDSVTKLQDHDVRLRIVSDDPLRGTVDYPLHGQTVSRSQYSSYPYPGEDLPFGLVALGGRVFQDLLIGNDAVEDLHILSIELSANVPGLSMTRTTYGFDPITFPHTIRTLDRDGIKVRLVWTPAAITDLRRDHDLKLRVTSDDPAHAVEEYRILGESADLSAKTLEETFLGWLIGASTSQQARQIAASLAEPTTDAGSAGKYKTASGCITPPSNMEAWYTGDGNPNDIQGSNNGTLQNGATFAAGTVGQAFILDGVDDYVEIGDKLDRGTADFTIETWIKGDPTMNAWARILDKGFSSGFSFHKVGSSNKVGFEFLASSNAFSTTSDVIDNNWHHVAVVKAGTMVTLYADGVAENNVTVSSASQDNALPMLIGYNPGEGIQGYWKGQIDELSIYDRALSAQEVQGIYNAGSAGKCKGGPTPTETAILAIDPAVFKNLTAEVPAFLGGGSVQLGNFSGSVIVSLISIPNDTERKLIRIDSGILTAPSVTLPSGLSTGPNVLTFGPPEESGGTLLLADGSYTAHATAIIVNDIIPDGLTVRGTYSGVYNAQSGKISVQSQSEDLFEPKDRLLNISTRLRVLTGDNVLIGGFIITGTDPKRVIIRGIAPSLFGVGATLADPTLELRQGDTLIASNDDWKEHEAEVKATTIPPTNDLEPAIVVTLDPGAYTAILAGKNGATGVGVVEVYDLARAADSKLANISTRGFVDTGNNVMIGGFIIGSPLVVSGVGIPQGGARALVRAIGPSLGDAGVPNSLQDPTLELRDANGALIEANDNWRSDHEAEIQATTIPPLRDEESAIVRTLEAGSYTAIVRGAGDTTGVAVVEVYNLN